MEWIIGLYLVAGVFKALSTLAADVTDKPIWMYSQKNPIVWALLFATYVVIWPFARK